MIRAISPDELAELLQKDLVDEGLPGGTAHLFDLRDAEDYLAAHVPGSRHLPTENNYPIRWIPQDCHTQSLVILIDRDGAKHGTARHVAHELTHRWFRRVRYLAGGFDAWKGAGKPTEEGGAAGSQAISDEGTHSSAHESGKVPWETPQDQAEGKYRPVRD